MDYNKPALSISQQIALLKSRGLLIGDDKKAEHYLSYISYYRLRAYTYPFQDNSSEEHPFHDGASFESVLDLYIFDRELRILVLDAIERIEIALRTQIIYQFAIENGSHWHEEESLFKNLGLFHRDQSKLKKELKRSTEVFIEHYYSKYTNPPHPPSWMSLEVVSLGTLSKLFENLRMSDAKKRIAKSFGLPHPNILESWMHAFSNVRNICAHHSRLWNRKLTVQPKTLKNPMHTWIDEYSPLPNKPFLTLSCLLYFMDRISPGHEWRKRFQQLIEDYSDVPIRSMGFPDNWEKDPLWKNM